MARVIRMTVDLEDDGSCRIIVGAAPQPPAAGRLAAETMTRLLEDLGALRAARSSGEWTINTHYERSVSSLMSVFANASGEISVMLRFLITAAIQQGDIAVLLVEAGSPGLRSLPWELIGMKPGRPPMEATGEAVIARLVTGSPPPPMETGLRLRHLLWSRDPAGEASTDLRLALDAELTARGEEPVLLLDLERPDALPSATLDILHLAFEREEDCMGLERLLADGCAGETLRMWMRRSVAVVLSLADERGDAQSFRELGERIVHATGATVLLSGPPTEAIVELARSFTAAILDNLPLTTAIRAGRWAIRGMDASLAGPRWLHPVLLCSHADLLDRGSLRKSPSWTPREWPTPAREAQELLDLARGRAAEVNAGFVGLEHLVLALWETVGGGAATAAARLLLHPHREAILRAFGERALCPVVGRLPDWDGTPRVQALGAMLHSGFRLDDLWTSLWEDPNEGLASFAESLLPALTREDPVESEPASELPPHAAPRLLEVLGGPEDGWVLEPAPNEPIGRRDPEGGASGALYSATIMVDPFLSRAHLIWLGSGRLLVKKRIRLRRHGRWQQIDPGPALVQAGDLMALTSATRLRVLP